MMILARKIAAACVALGVAGSSAAMVPIAGDPVAIDSGRVAGTVIDDSVKAYLGIPFAAPPVRENRWREPQDVAPWPGIYAADQMKPECPQGLRSASINHYFGEEAVSEDCLTLNLWAPADAKAGDKRPVVVWIYGGAFAVGSAANPIYSGVPLARQGVIYLAANYRLGPLGFLAHPELTGESGHNASGNYGFLDQVAALRWVKRNIAAFGGDPDNVTLIGQSAGSMSINNLQASPLAKGLFARVVGLSGAAVRGGPSDPDGPSRQKAEAVGLELQKALKAPDLAAMRMISFDKVLAAAQQAGVRPLPCVDGWFLPESPTRIFEAGKQSDVPVITGWTANDIGTNPPIRKARSLAAYQQAAETAFGKDAATFLKLWPASDDDAAARQAEQVGRESGFGLGAYNWAALQALHGRQPSYLYLFAKVQPFSPGVTFSDFDPATAGAYHMGDVPYMLGTYEAFNLFRHTRDWGSRDRELSEALQDLLVAYARTGKPETPRLKLVRFDPKHPEQVVIDDRISVESLNAAAIAFLLDHPAPMPAVNAAPSRPTY